jgi:hypothetical protein
MARRFTDAKALLGDLLDRYETGTARPVAYPDYGTFASVVAADAFLKELRVAEAAGAVRITCGKGNKHEEVVHVRLVAADLLYKHLRRAPIVGIASQAHSQIVQGLVLHPHLENAASEILAVWHRARSWGGFRPQDARKLSTAFLLAQAIIDRRHSGLDYRTFSRRIAGHSKALEQLEGAVVRLLTRVLDLPPAAKPREALRTIGLEKFASPLLIAGGVDLAEANLSCEQLIYFGIAPNEAGRIRFRENPEYLLTIENFASFSRHAIEGDPRRIGTSIYVGGYPSLATQQALRVLADKLPASVPIFHWSDIDADGIWIFRTIEQALGRPLRPHLMSAEIAEELGVPSAGRSTLRSCPKKSGIYSLAAYLSQEGAKVLEQEELDPCVPACAKEHLDD